MFKPHTDFAIMSILLSGERFVKIIISHKFTSKIPLLMLINEFKNKKIESRTIFRLCFLILIEVAIMRTIW